ncbi:hypothetical protein EYF80_032839 [Liparis tanakae]|uniref:Uncharacterized protein n=1 Tax=Liparis tanakae TaxID=230148 RepID=A0A4Z2GUB8_9TELE|nr:hypothetical protein EYF80_032839 [Liparis tanakae]
MSLLMNDASSGRLEKESRAGRQPGCCVCVCMVQNKHLLTQPLCFRQKRSPYHGMFPLTALRCGSLRL